MNATEQALAELSTRVTSFLMADLNSLGPLIEARDRADKILMRTRPVTCDCGTSSGFHGATCAIAKSREPRT